MLRRQIANGTLIGMAGMYLWHFSNIWRFGKFYVCEPNIFILSAETVFFIGLVVFGIWNLKKETKS